MPLLGSMVHALHLENNVSNGPKVFRKAKPDAPRVLAFNVISSVNQHDAYSNLLLPQKLSESALDTRDKAFVTELVYGTLRMQGLYDYIFKQISNRPWSEVDPAIQDIARLGAHQIFSMRTADHAAVSSTVDLARGLLGESEGSFVNALMRKASSQDLQGWLSPLKNEGDIVKRLAIKHSHPEWIVSAYLDLLKDPQIVESELISNNIAALPTLVSWPGQSTQEDLVEVGGIKTEFSMYGARFDGAPSSIDLIKSRKAGVQDEGSQLVASIFYEIAKNASSFLDLCAGPGGKAALIAHLCQRDGKEFTANEISEPRAELVKQVIGNFPVRVGDARDIADDGWKYDAILADVPCTGIGALRRRPEVRWRRTLKDLSPLLTLQNEISEAALSILNPGGFFGYATCSPHYAETTGQVNLLLKRHPELELIDITSYMPTNLEGATRNGALSLWGYRHNTDAMFLAIFRKSQ